MQLRMPAMDANAIRDNPDVARELLIHRLRTIPGAEYQAIKAERAGLATVDKFIAAFETRDVTIENLVDFYALFYGATTGATKYVREASETAEPTDELQDKIVKSLPKVLAGLEQTMKNKRGAVRDLRRHQAKRDRHARAGGSAPTDRRGLQRNEEGPAGTHRRQDVSGDGSRERRGQRLDPHRRLH